jgi:excinuclease UvrABC nuclease subunit
MSIFDFALKGKHNQYNTMVAALTTTVLGIRKERIREAITSFEGIEHRMEHVATVRGILFINDSKATNVNSTWYALESLDKLGLRGKVAIIGIAKKLEEIYFPGDSIPLYLDKRSESLKIIQQIRDEAHRFGITHHRNKRSSEAIKSELDILKGLGEKTKEVLFKEFKTIKNMRSKSLEELVLIIGKAKGLKLFNFLNPKN